GVPKILGRLKSSWCPESLVVSFKLETDPKILFDKASGAIKKYGVDAVVANVLESRYKELWIVRGPGGEDKGYSTELLTKPDNEDIEVVLVEALERLHSEHIEQK
ncbi:hypothetical protein FOL47_005662, partial [Perkinsus chesapeaki]